MMSSLIQTPLKIALINDTSAWAISNQQTLIANHVELYLILQSNQLALQISQLKTAEVIILNMAHSHAEVIASCAYNLHCATVLFTPPLLSPTLQQADIQQAIHLGLTNYISSQIHPAYLHVILHVSIAQYKQQRKLLEELNAVQQKLADRKDIEKAKIYLMHLYQINENDAFIQLRENAMHQRISLGELARKVLQTKSLTF